MPIQITIPDDVIALSPNMNTSRTDKQTWTVLTEIYREPSSSRGNWAAYCPAGFDTYNGTSVPRGLWEEIGHPLDLKFLKASIVHDALYQRIEFRTDSRWGNKKPTQRIDIDRLFWLMLIEEGVSRAEALQMYVGVRVGGYWSFNDGSALTNPPSAAEIRSTVLSAWREMRDWVKGIREGNQGLGATTPPMRLGLRSVARTKPLDGVLQNTFELEVPGVPEKVVVLEVDDLQTEDIDSILAFAVPND